MKPSLNANTATKENLYKTVIPYRKKSVRNFFAYFKNFLKGFRTSPVTIFSIISVASVLALLVVSWMISAVIYDHKEI